MRDVLLCSDLDRTILPNGPQPESPRARSLLAWLARRPEFTLAYVSGRHLALLRQAVDEYGIPLPHYAIGDVGTTIYDVRDGDWRPLERWHEEIAADWDGKISWHLRKLFMDLDSLRIQEDGKQNVFKLSYYASRDLDAKALFERMRRRLDAEGIRAGLIWSVDETLDIGLVDVLPARATKLHAIRFLMKTRGFSPEHTVFAGDSGNDLPALTSGLQAVLVRNALPEVRDEAQRRIEACEVPDRLYVARGGFLGMNGNYAAGVLEGLAHFLPHTRYWMEEALKGT